MVATMEAVRLRWWFLVYVLVMVSTTETHSADLEHGVWQKHGVEAKKQAVPQPNPEKVVDIAELDRDEVQQKRAEEAKKAARHTSQPNPQKIIDIAELDREVQQKKAARHANQQTNPENTTNITDLDEVWKKRAEQAKKAARQAYQPNPKKVMDQFNKRVNKATKGDNSTRRELSKSGDQCTATNPIDRCWRCQKNWEKNRMKLANCVLGFGRFTTGGKRGKIYTVTDPSDDDLVNPKPGTLRYAVIQPEPLWIIFAHNMKIRLSEELIMTSNKTIDGRGAKVEIAGGSGITLQFVNNIIIHGLRIHDVNPGNGGQIRDSVDHYGYRMRSDGDGISIFGSTNIWIDHLSMYRCADGLIDAIEGSTAMTISNCRFTQHREVMLFGASDSYSEDSIMQITLAFNRFGRGLEQRLPRVRWGFVHVVNNDYNRWLMYAIGGSQSPTIISQGNRFTASPNPYTKEVTKRAYAPESEWKNWLWRSEGDLMKNGAFFTASGNSGESYSESKSNKDLISPKPGSYVPRLTRYAGALNCEASNPC